MAPGVLPHNIPARHGGEAKAPADTVRKPKNKTKKNKKKNGKPGTILVPYQGTSSLSVLSAAQLIQKHTSSSLTQSQPEIHHSSSSSLPPRHVTMHMYLPRAFRIQYSNIYDLKITSQLLTILSMHRHPPRAFYTHYYNSYILKLRRLTLYQYKVHQKRLKFFKSAISTVKKLCLPKRLVTSLQRSTRTVRPVALNTTYLTETTHSPRTTFHLPLPLPPAGHQP